MRLIGPNCFGIAVPASGLDATFSACTRAPGMAGLVCSPAASASRMVEQLSRLGIGISSFASVGNKLDVSSNDMLMWWEQDRVPKLAVLYIESFGNPRKFARTARRVGAADAGAHGARRGRTEGRAAGKPPRTPGRSPPRW